MSARVIIAITGVVGMALCGLIASLIHQEMVVQVNERLPQESQFSPLGWYAPKTRRLLREYRRLFPRGKLLWLERAIGVAMAACGLCLIWAIGFFQALVGTHPQ